MSNSESVLFPNRFGLETRKLIDSDFPDSARIGLWHVLHRITEKGRTEGWVRIGEELLRINRIKDIITANDADDRCYHLINDIDWKGLYIFCERVYKKILLPEIEHDYNGNPETMVDLDEVRLDFEEDINQLFEEEAIVYRMKDGLFYRPGRFHSQKIASNAIIVLLDPRLQEARNHFNKSRAFFTKSPEADFPNSIKEAVSALEAAIKNLFPTKQKDFEKIIRNIKDANGEPIPPTIIKGILSSYYYRGAGNAVAHGGATGGKATAAVAEWIMTVVAASIIYLRDIAQSHEAEPPPF